MGRPIKKKYFGSVATGVGGEGVASVAVTNTSTNGVYTSTAVISFSTPDLVGGSAATGTPTIVGGKITAITVNSAGSGYVSAPTILVTPATTGTTATYTVTLTAAVSNVIAASAYIPTGSSAKVADIQKQESSHRYRVATADGVGICKLVTTSTLTAGQMTITATDSASGTYYVTKLTAHKAVLTRNTGTQFATGATANWNLTSAVAGVSVVLSNN